MNQKILIILAIIGGVGFMLLVLLGFFVLNSVGKYSTDSNLNRKCDIPVVAISGELLEDLSISGEIETQDEAAGWQTYTNIIENQIKLELETDPQAIVLVIDSPGGELVAGESIVQLIRGSEVPTVALIRGVGMSSAYYIAAATDHVIASKYSQVGSIGITHSFTVEHQKNKQEGIEYIELTSGAFKDLGSSGRAVSWSERQMIITRINELHDLLVGEISLYRNMDLLEASNLADGRAYSGVQAHKNGLIDEIGGWNEVEIYISSLLEKEIVLCR